MGNVSFDELYRNDEKRSADESPFDTESEIKFIKKEVPKSTNDNDYGIGSVHQTMHNDDAQITLIVSSRDTKIQEADSDLESMPDDELESIFGFEAGDDDENANSENKAELSKTDKATADHMFDELVYIANSQDAHLNAFADKPSESDPLGHLQTAISLLTAKVNNLESSLSQRVANKIKDSVPRMVVDAFEERIPKLLSDTLKSILLDLLKDSVKKDLLKFDKRIKKLSELKFLNSSSNL
ncbi:hypothetical protein Tco_0940303 [Tanacetum coccineum]|uniref:Uncharacterized protein n=1 Tax=Tanacetum coccineum TaxID=301880 RepID=A0ABQ5DQ74_9ASTR